MGRRFSYYDDPFDDGLDKMIADLDDDLDEMFNDEPDVDLNDIFDGEAEFNDEDIKAKQKLRRRILEQSQRDEVSDFIRTNSNRLLTFGYIFNRLLIGVMVLGLMYGVHVFMTNTIIKPQLPPTPPAVESIIPSEKVEKF